MVLAAATGTALASPATAQAADSNGSDEVRIVARKLADGRGEFALRTDQTVSCWGANHAGQSSAPSGRFAAVRALHAHSCALDTDGNVTCWGQNFAGREGQTDAPAGGSSPTHAGDAHSCGLRADDTVICWGNNDDGHIDVPTSWTNPQVCRTAPTVMIA